MSQNDRMAAAAHLHVALRRKTGRIIDTEWMVCNDEYARAMVDYARSKAHEEGDEDLLALANRLDAQLRHSRPVTSRTAPAPASASMAAQARDSLSHRYVGRLR
ncbi:hypothetical protein [Hydrogenophaga sp. 5NK40-0174]|uniref:hypothetical protein n=1 Tax=Hydrogenophaga sp. 5NK40-0174 TaxID=3127649 RepID=UPI00310B637D